VYLIVNHKYIEYHWNSIGRHMTSIQIEVSDEDQYQRLSNVKDKYGLTWRGMLIHAARNLEGDGIDD